MAVLAVPDGLLLVETGSLPCNWLSSRDNRRSSRGKTSYSSLSEEVLFENVRGAILYYFDSAGFREVWHLRILAFDMCGEDLIRPGNR